MARDENPLSGWDKGSNVDPEDQLQSEKWPGQ
jgi:hypothetical protein